MRPPSDRHQTATRRHAPPLTRTHTHTTPARALRSTPRGHRRRASAHNDRGVGVVDAHEALAAAAGEVVDQDGVGVGDRRLLGDEHTIRGGQGRLMLRCRILTQSEVIRAILLEGPCWSVLLPACNASLKVVWVDWWACLKMRCEPAVARRRRRRQPAPQLSSGRQAWPLRRASPVPRADPNTCQLLQPQQGLPMEITAAV